MTNNIPKPPSAGAIAILVAWVLVVGVASWVGLTWGSLWLIHWIGLPLP